MILINLRNISLSYGQHPLLDHVDLTISSGEHIALIGRNGMGKSTLLKLIAGELEPDQGNREHNSSLKIAYLPQTVPTDFSGTCFDVVASGLGELGQIISEYHALNLSLGHDDQAQLERLSALQQYIELHQGWNLQQKVNKILSFTSLDADTEVAQLSGGMKRRVLLAKALVTDPDVLILDEPTNHLDIEAILWLENFLKNFTKTLLFVSHDRAFMQALGNRILELDQGKLISWDGTFNEFQLHKEAALAAEATQQALFDKRLAAEETWIRQGIKARRTRNEGRVRALEKMRRERQARQTRLGNVKMATQTLEQSGKIVFEANHISHKYDGNYIIKDFSTLIMRGDKIGILGPNGCGKSTLLKILLGHMTPDEGEVKHGTKLIISYFDQHRAQLDPEKTVQDNVYDGGDTIVFNERSIHILTYLQNFLFSPQRARMKVKVLSGGERNRLLLAKLFTKPANVLVLDEPTNDLDVETLELLEELLLEYSGTVLLVSHDRTFLNNIATSTIVFEGHGKLQEYVGGYDDWLRQNNTKPKPADKKSEKSKEKSSSTNKLSYKDKFELENLPEKIASLEKEIALRHELMAQPSFYQESSEKIAAEKKNLAELERELEQAFQRWSELEEKNA